LRIINWLCWLAGGSPNGGRKVRAPQETVQGNALAPARATESATETQTARKGKGETVR